MFHNFPPLLPLALSASVNLDSPLHSFINGFSSSSLLIRGISETMMKEKSPDNFDGVLSNYNLSLQQEVSPTRASHHHADHGDNDKHPTTPPTTPQQQQDIRSSSPTVSLLSSTSTYPTRPIASCTTTPPPPPSPSPSHAMSAGTSTAPFAVPKPWQQALSMVSINAGLTPQALLHAYYQHAQPQQQPSRRQIPTYVTTQHNHHHHQHQTTDVQTDLDIQRLFPQRLARARGIRGVSVRCADGDPARVTLLAIVVDDRDPATGAAVVRLVTNTSVRHVLGEAGADCPLWLPVRFSSSSSSPAAAGEGTKDEEGRGGAAAADGGGSNSSSTKTCQIVPCCDEWAAAVDFEMPLSAEEKQVPAVVDRLVEELQRKRLALLARERDLQDREAELTRLRRRHQGSGEDDRRSGGVMAAAPVVAGQRQHHAHALAFDADVLVQHWWAAAMVVAFMLVIIVWK